MEVDPMPSLHLIKVASRFDNYRYALDKKRRDVFDYILFELAGRREETLVMHPNHTEAALMNALIEMEMRLEAVEKKTGDDAHSN
jgi:hypothetical protein